MNHTSNVLTATDEMYNLGLLKPFPVVQRSMSLSHLRLVSVGVCYKQAPGNDRALLSRIRIIFLVLNINNEY